MSQDLDTNLQNVAKGLETEVKKFMLHKEKAIIKMKKEIEELQGTIVLLKERKDNLEKELQLEIEKKWGALKKEQQILKKKYVEDDEIIRLNVGGRIFQVLASTLKVQVPMSIKEKNIKTPHFFSGLCSTSFNVQKDDDDNIFVDRDGTHFKYILNYLRAKGDLKKCALPQDEDTIAEVIHEAKYYCLNHLAQFLKEGEEFKTEVLKDNDISQLSNVLFGKEQKRLKLVFSSKRDGYQSFAFQAKVYNKGPVLIAVQLNNGYIFGGYSPQSFTGRNNYINDPNSFIFSLKNSEGKKIYKFVQKANSSQYAVYDNTNYIGFGGGHDFCLYLNQNQSASSYTNLNYSYADQGKGQHFLAGKRQFTCVAYEVYQVLDYNSKDDDEEEGESDDESSESEEEW